VPVFYVFVMRTFARVPLDGKLPARDANASVDEAPAKSPAE
jgi:hypothetical protein